MGWWAQARGCNVCSGSLDLANPRAGNARAVNGE